MLALIQAGADGLDRVRQAAASANSTPLEQVQLLAPIPRPSKNVFCLGLNYKEHVAESAAGRGANPEELPKYPIWFTKAVTSLTGPYDDIRVDLRLSDKYDWEVELAVLIGKGGRNIPKTEPTSTSTVTASSTTSPCAISSAATAGSGSRARASTRLVLCDPGW